MLLSKYYFIKLLSIFTDKVINIKFTSAIEQCFINTTFITSFSTWVNFTTFLTSLVQPVSYIIIVCGGTRQCNKSLPNIHLLINNKRNEEKSQTFSMLKRHGNFLHVLCQSNAHAYMHTICSHAPPKKKIRISLICLFHVVWRSCKLVT